MGYAEEDIIMDVVAVYSGHHPEQEITKNAVSNLMEARNVRSFYVNMNSIQAALEAYPRVQQRFYFQDSGIHCGDFS